MLEHAHSTCSSTRASLYKECTKVPRRAIFTTFVVEVAVCFLRKFRYWFLFDYALNMRDYDFKMQTTAAVS